MKDKLIIKDRFSAMMVCQGGISDKLEPKGHYKFDCIGPKEALREQYLYLRDTVLPKYKDTLSISKIKHEMEALLEDKWQDVIENAVPIPAKNNWLDTQLSGSGYTATWYMGLISATGYTELNANDTAASHTGWQEDTNYSQSNRLTITFAAASNASKAVLAPVSFQINASTTLKGAFVISDNTKGGTSGLLLSQGLFLTGDKPPGNGDLINGTYTAYF